MRLTVLRIAIEKCGKRFVLCAWIALLLAIPPALSLGQLRESVEARSEWTKEVSHVVWVAYSPSTANPSKGLEATPDSIRKDLTLLRAAGFTGLVTYSSVGVLGRELPALATSEGFNGLIMGIWDPSSATEIAAATNAGKNPIVLGFCMGNEGLGKRYQLSELSAQMQSLRNATHKPVSTSEPIDSYSDENLLRSGDWVFPNAHPYFHDRRDPDAAVRWTQGEYEDLVAACHCFVLFKEVGLPTAGDSASNLSEAAQERYYLQLAKTGIHFVYFESFDAPWKNEASVEPHWGIFNVDRTPKELALRLMGKESPRKTQPSDGFYIYQDADAPDSHFKPTGYMGDVGDIQMDETFGGDPHSGKTCIRVSYSAKGRGPNQCSYKGPCKWAGVYWQEPPNNWGEEAVFKNKGFNLSGYTRLVFWARAEKESTVKFQVGGIDKVYGDSLKYPRSITARLTTSWQEFTIDLAGKDLSHIIGGFAWVATYEANPGGVTFYLDDIRFETK